MRAPLRMLPITVALLAPVPTMGQDAPRVLFCSGPCFAVDTKGVRTPAPKGTQLAPGQRLETGQNGYAQVKLGPDAAVGIGEQARVRFDLDAVVLDEGRLRMVGGKAIGRPESRPVELRTGDGTFVLRSADVEVKKSARPGTTAAMPTFMKLNAGDASLRSGQGEIAISRQGVQGIAAGKVMTGALIPITEVAPASRTTLVSAAPATAPVVALPTNISTPLVRQPIVLAPTLSPTLSPTIVTQPILTPVVSSGDLLLRQPVVDSTTGMTTTLTKVITEPVTTTTTTTTTAPKTLTLQPITTTTSPTLSTTTSRLLIR